MCSDSANSVLYIQVRLSKYYINNYLFFDEIQELLPLHNYDPQNIYFYFYILKRVFNAWKRHRQLERDGY